MFSQNFQKMLVKNLEKIALLSGKRTGGARASVCAIKSKNGQKFFENGPNYCREGKIKSVKNSQKYAPK